MYCECKPEGERVELIHEAYPNPVDGTIVHKWLCCACGYTKKIEEQAAPNM